MLKSLFWLSVIVIALPLVTGGGTGAPSDYEPEPVQMHEIAFAVQAVASDVLGMCDREPDACHTGERLLWTARSAARDLTGRAHDWLEDGPAEGEGQGS